MEKASDNETKVHDSGSNCNFRTTLLMEQHVSAELGNLFQLRENKSSGRQNNISNFSKDTFSIIERNKNK